MNDLLWFDGITMQTTVDKIGWTYVLLAFLLIVLGIFIEKIRRDLTSND